MVCIITFSFTKSDGTKQSRYAENTTGCIERRQQDKQFTAAHMEETIDQPTSQMHS